MMSHRKPLAALAALTATCAFAVPAATASAATTPTVDPQVCQLFSLSETPFGPAGMFVGGASLSSVLTTAGSSVGCQAAAPQTSLLPTLQLWR